MRETDFHPQYADGATLHQWQLDDIAKWSVKCSSWPSSAAGFWGLYRPARFAFPLPTPCDRPETTINVFRKEDDGVLIMERLYIVDPDGEHHFVERAEASGEKELYLVRQTDGATFSSKLTEDRRDGSTQIWAAGSIVVPLAVVGASEHSFRAIRELQEASRSLCLAVRGAGGIDALTKAEFLFAGTGISSSDWMTPTWAFASCVNSINALVEAECRRLKVELKRPDGTEVPLKLPPILVHDGHDWFISKLKNLALWIKALETRLFPTKVVQAPGRDQGAAHGVEGRRRYWFTRRGTSAVAVSFEPAPANTRISHWRKIQDGRLGLPNDCHNGDSVDANEFVIDVDNSVQTITFTAASGVDSFNLL